MDESSLERAYALFRQAVRDIGTPERISPEELGARLRSMSERILSALEGHDTRETDDVFTRLRTQASDIADDLRRAEDLMRRHQSDHD